MIGIDDVTNLDDLKEFLYLDYTGHMGHGGRFKSIIEKAQSRITALEAENKNLNERLTRQNQEFNNALNAAGQEHGKEMVNLIAVAKKVLTAQATPTTFCGEDLYDELKESLDDMERIK